MLGLCLQKNCFCQTVQLSLMSLNSIVNTVPLLYIRTDHKQVSCKTKYKYLARAWLTELHWSLCALVKRQEGQIISGNMLSACLFLPLVP